MPAAWTQNIDWHWVDQTLNDLPKGEHRAFIQKVADMVDKSVSTIYRERARRFGRVKVIEREATVVTDDEVRIIAKILKEYEMDFVLKGNRSRLSTEAAIEIAEERGLVTSGKLCVPTVNRRLREAGFRIDEPRVRYEAAYACQQVQIDFSRSKHFQVIEPCGDGDWLLKASAKELHYKDGAVRLRTWVCQIRDEYSRLRIIKYFAATGEDRFIGIATLRFWLNRQDDDHLMTHVAERIKSDQGAFLKSQEGNSVCESLRMDIKKTKPGNSASQGKVERGFRSLWSRFEAPLAARVGAGNTIRLSDLCRMVHQFTIEEHERPHPIQKDQTRGGMYQQSILQHRPPEVDVDVADLALRTWERWADASRKISINNKNFEVPPYAAGKWVRIYRNMNNEFLGTLIDGYRDKPFNVRPYRFADLDQFEGRPHQTFAQEIEQEIREDRKVQVQRLRPQAPKVQPQSVFARPKAEDATPEYLTMAEASAVLGQALYEMGVSEAHRKIILSSARRDGALFQGMLRSEVQDVITELTTVYRQAV